MRESELVVSQSVSFLFSTYFVSCSGSCAPKEKWHRKEHIIIIIIIVVPNSYPVFVPGDVGVVALVQWFIQIRVILMSLVYTICVSVCLSVCLSVLVTVVSA